MKYNYILCDADDTLLDFPLAERYAFKESCIDCGTEDSDEIYDIYHGINISHWKKLELGLTTREKLKIERFEELFVKTGILPAGRAEEFADRYLENLSHQCYVLPGVLDVLADLSRDYDIYIITNGLSKTQHGRLDNSPVVEYTKGVFISEDIGFAKPSREYFDYVIRSIGDYDLSKYIVVGDSPTSDIKGAVAYGIDSCHITMGKEYIDYGQTYTLKYFNDIRTIL